MHLSDSERVSMLMPPSGKVDAVIDTDAFNEIDDQFAIPYALLQKNISVKAIYAAPFVNHKTDDPAEGMRLSLVEIARLLDLLGIYDIPAYAGVKNWLTEETELSPAAEDLIARAANYNATNPLYVIALGAPTNIAQALSAAPEIGKKIVVVWLGSHPSTWHTSKCYNSEQDVPASNLLFDGIAPLVHIPAANVTEHLRTSRPQLSAELQPHGQLATYLLEIYDAYAERDGCFTKELWDLGPVAWVAHPEWVQTTLVQAPNITPAGGWSTHPHRPLMAEAWRLNVDAILRDMFAQLAGK